MDKTFLKTVLYKALAEPIGLELTSTDPGRARQSLYSARRELGDPSLANLQFRITGPGTLVICKSTVDAGGAEAHGL